MPITTISLGVNTNGSVVNWSGPNGFSSNQINPLISIPGTYTVLVRSSNGCTASASTVVNGDTTEPTVSASGGILTCDVTSVILNASTNATIVGWTGPNGFTSNQSSPSVDITGIYTVTVQSSNGCTASASTVVSGDTTAPNVSATGGSLTCDLTSITLSANTTADIISWSGPNGFSSNEVAPVITVPGTYTVTVKGTNGCSASADAIVSGDTTPPIVGATGGTLTCIAPSTILIANTVSTVIGWTGPNGFTTNLAAPTVNEPGTYTVTVRSSNGCTATASTVVNSDTTAPTVSATGGVITCDQTSLTLSVSTDGTVENWTGPNGFNSNQANPLVSAVGIYYGYSYRT